MKEHNFQPHKTAFAISVYACTECGATRFDNEKPYYDRNGMAGRTVSEDCDEAKRQMLERQKT